MAIACTIRSRVSHGFWCHMFVLLGYGIQAVSHALVMVSLFSHCTVVFSVILRLIGCLVVWGLHWGISYLSVSLLPWVLVMSGLGIFMHIAVGVCVGLFGSICIVVVSVLGSHV